MSITDDLRMAVAKVWDEWADLHGVAAPAHIVDAWLSVTIAADALDSEVAALTAQRDAARRQIQNLIDAFAHIVMDTDEDRALHDEIIGIARRSVAALAGASPVAADPPTEEQR